jgi:hypothetical protein
MSRRVGSASARNVRSRAGAAAAPDDDGRRDADDDRRGDSERVSRIAERCGQHVSQ